MPNKNILIVDDNDGQRITLESILKRAGFNVTSADCGNAALSAAEKSHFAAVLLDIKMPDLTGIDVLKVIKSNQPDTMVIMMTGYSETDYAIDALNAGASAYLQKPANIEQIKVLLATAVEHDRLVEENKAMADAMREWNTQLEGKVTERTQQLQQAHQMTMDFYEELKKNFESTLEVLSIAIDQRDPLTCSHSFRVTQYAVEMAKILGLDANDVEKVRYSGLMHDLGKIEVEKDILCKEGSLTTDEYKKIQDHAKGTFELLSKFKFKRNLADVPMIASSHHERFDGSGYPKKLKGEDIPLLARVLAVADVMDAITSKRHYRNSMSIMDALGIMKREAGGHFDPQCVEALFKINVASFIKIHMAEHLEKLKSEDIIEMTSPNLGQLYEINQTENPSAEQMKLLKVFHRYFQGPVPVRFKDTIEPAPNFSEENKD